MNSSFLQLAGLTHSANRTVRGDDFRTSYCLVTRPPPPSNTTIPPDKLFLAWEYIASILCAVGAFINILLLITVLKSSHLRKGTGLLIIHLLLSQLILCLILIPIAVHHVAQVMTGVNRAPSNCEFCRYQHFLHMTFDLLVNWSEALLAINRFVAVAFPLHFRAFNRRLSVRLGSLAFCWLSVLAITVPALFGDIAMYKMTPLGACTMIPFTKIAFGVLSYATYSPLLVTAISTLIISVKFLTPNVQIRQELPRELSQPSKPAQLKKRTTFAERQRLTSKMLVMSFGLSLACQLPHYVIVLMGLSSQYPKLTLLFYFQSVFQFASTPIIFFVVNRDYRERSLKLWRRLFGGKSVVALFETSSGLHGVSSFQKRETDAV